MGGERFANTSGLKGDSFPTSPEGVVASGIESDYTHLTRIELLELGIETERMEVVPVSMIVMGESIVDDAHVEDLADSMKGSRGQIVPIAVRARLGRTTGNPVVYFDVIDGFHRTEGMKINGTKEAKAIVVYGCDDEELSDLRVLAANSVRSVQFARVAKWMQDSFAKSVWGGRGLTLSQALAIAVFDSSGKRSGLTEEEVEQLKEWARIKGEKWGKPISTIYTDVCMLEKADPELVSRVRVGGGGKKSKKGEISPARLRAVVTELPDDHGLQQRVIEVVCERNLVSPKARLLARAVARLKDDPEGLRESLEDPSLTISVMEDELGLESTPARPEADEWEDVDEDRRQKNKGVPVLKENGGDAFFWRSLDTLSDMEREVMSLMFDGECLNDWEVAQRVGVLPQQLIAIIRSAFRKYQIHLRGNHPV